MASKSFDDLIREHSKAVEGQAFDWEPRKAWWQGQVKQLADDIERWLAVQIGEGLLRLTRCPFELEEEVLGKYESLLTEVSITANPGAKLRLVPRATLIIGGYGRVDARGTVGSAQLVLVDKGPPVEGTEPWKHASWFVASGARGRPIEELNEDTFQRMFLDLLGVAD